MLCTIAESSSWKIVAGSNLVIFDICVEVETPPPIWFKIYFPKSNKPITFSELLAKVFRQKNPTKSFFWILSTFIHLSLLAFIVLTEVSCQFQSEIQIVLTYQKWCYYQSLRSQKIPSTNLYGMSSLKTMAWIIWQSILSEIILGLFKFCCEMRFFSFIHCTEMYITSNRIYFLIKKIHILRYFSLYSTD